MDRDRRTLLRSVALAGSVGLAGCFSGTPDDAGSPTPTDGGNSPSTPRGTPTRSPAVTGTTASSPTPTGTSRPTGTPDTWCDDTAELCAEPTHLLTFDDGELNFLYGTTTTVTGRVYNPYLFEVVEVEVTLDPPGEDWTITPVEGTSMEALPSMAEREATWEVSVPRTAIGEYEFTSQCTYRAATNTADVQEAFAVSVVGE